MYAGSSVYFPVFIPLPPPTPRPILESWTVTELRTVRASKNIHGTWHHLVMVLPRKNTTKHALANIAKSGTVRTRPQDGRSGGVCRGCECFVCRRIVTAAPCRYLSCYQQYHQLPGTVRNQYRCGSS